MSIFKCICVFMICLFVFNYMCFGIYIHIFATFVVVVVFVSIPLLFALCFKITVSLNVGPSVD